MIVNREDILSVQETIYDDGVTAEKDIKFSVPALSQQNLHLIERTSDPETDTDDAVSGRLSESGENLIQVDIIDSGAFRDV